MQMPSGRARSKLWNELAGRLAVAAYESGPSPFGVKKDNSVRAWGRSGFAQTVYCRALAQEDQRLGVFGGVHRGVQREPSSQAVAFGMRRALFLVFCFFANKRL